MNFCPTCGARLTKRPIDGTERDACAEPCGFVHWNNPTPVVAALVRVDDRIVLARNASWPAGFFSLISGFLEAGEAPDDAIARETLEELGLVSERVDFIGHYPFAQMNQIILAYVVDARGTPTPNDELAEVRSLSMDEFEAFDFGPLRLGAWVRRDWFARRGGELSSKTRADES